MKTVSSNFLLILLLLAVSFFSAGQVVAQQRLGVTTSQKNITAAGTNRFYYANSNEPPRAIEFNERTVTSANFLANINQYLNIPAKLVFTQVETNTDKLGMRHRLLQQYYKGIPVDGMLYRVHEKDGFVRSANGKAVRDLNVDTRTVITEDIAFNLAVKYANTKDTTFRHGKKLIVSKGLTFAPESFAMAFQFDIVVTLVERWRISVDAHNGQLLNKVSLVNSCFNELPPTDGTGTGLTNYYGIQTIRVDKNDNGSSQTIGTTEHGGKIGTYDFRNGRFIILQFGFPYPVYPIYSENNSYTQSYQKAAVSVHWGAEQAYEYYFTKHNRNSYDNNGSEIRSYVHVDEEMNNAFWIRNLLAFGDGTNGRAPVELDVVSHELTHGVTQYEAGLNYYYEPGALNESFSDIMGKAVEFHVFGDTATWQLSKHYRDGGIRDFTNPNIKNQADTYAGDFWVSGEEDYGGVHYNSGVQNFWFYLLSEGGSGVNDHRFSYSVEPIGIEAAANIAYRNLTEYLSIYSDYLDSRIGSLLATADLYGENSAIYQRVDHAWDAVGVIDEPIITILEVFDITATTVKIKGNLLPRAASATYHFEYGTTPALGSSTPAATYAGKVEGKLTGLQSQTKYYLRLVATNENGNTFSPIEFTTISLAPMVEIIDAIDVTETSATLRGRINPNSLGTAYHFEYGTTPSFGLVTPTHSLPDTTEYLEVSLPVVNLQPRKTYYFRLVGNNGFKSITTTSLSFFTAANPIILSYSPLTAPIGTEITITGKNFNPNPANNLVNFGATRGTVISASGTQIKVMVPSGASLDVITALDTESGLTGKSSGKFVPTFTTAFKKTDLHLRIGSNDLSISKTIVKDMDGDGKPDIVALHAGGFSVLQNVNQGGNLSDESFIRNTYNTDELFWGELFVVDIDGNGRQDVIGRIGNGFRIYPNLSVSGYIFFGPPVDLPSEYMSGVAFDDFDTDGRIDIGGAVPTPGDSCVIKIIRNQNPRGFISVDNFTEVYANRLSFRPDLLMASDLNNDGKPEIFSAEEYRNNLLILKNNSEPGVFIFDATIITDLSSGRFRQFVINDLNADGLKDIASHARYDLSALDFFENNGAVPDFLMTTPIVTSLEFEASSEIVDMNGDGNVDLLLGNNLRELILLKNNTAPGEHLSPTAFEKMVTCGLSLEGTNGNVETQVSVNDLNGDGRPEVISTYYYYYGPRDGYLMEIWQNSDNDCIDPSLVTVNASNTTATVVLPPNSDINQYEIYYSPDGSNTWWSAGTTLYNLSPGWHYQVKVRAKCYLAFTGYHYIDFITDCVNTNNFSVTNIGVDNAFISMSNFGSLNVQYSVAGQDQWINQYYDHITNLSPGTTYDIRFRGDCPSESEYKYLQFTTLCPKLAAINLTNITYNKAIVTLISNYPGEPILEYSADNINWTRVDETTTIYPLIPGTQYFLRGSLSCTSVNAEYLYKSFTTPCPKVSMLAADVTPFSATIHWDDESQTGNYMVNYSTTGGPVKTVQTSAAFLTLNDLKPGTYYTVSVAPQCIAEKQYTSFGFNTVCYVPFDLSIDRVSHTSAEISWRDNFTGLPYTIDYSISGSGIWKKTETSSTSVLLSDLRPGTKYDVRVHITCPVETSLFASLLVETALYDETTFYPNPTEGKIAIRPSRDLIGNPFHIYDRVGRDVASGTLRNYTLDLSNLPPGIYTLKIEGEKIMRIMKQ